MGRIVADANVVLKLFISEEDTDRALAMLRSYAAGEISIAAPSLLTYEVLSGARYNTLRRFNKNELEKIADTLANYGFELLEPGPEIISKAVSISVDYKISIYDAFYAAFYAAAAELNDAILYTADGKMIDAVKKPFVKHIKITSKDILGFPNFILEEKSINICSYLFLLDGSRMELERTVSEKGQVVIPKDVRKRLGLKPGSEVVFDVKDNVATMTPKKSPREIVEEFCSIPEKKFRHLTAKKLEKILDEEYEVP